MTIVAAVVSATTGVAGAQDPGSTTTDPAVADRPASPTTVPTEEPSDPAPTPSTAPAAPTATTSPTTVAPAPASPQGDVIAASEPIAGNYIVVLRDTLSATAVTDASSLATERGGEVTERYRHALSGFAAEGLTETEAREIAADPRVAYVEEDGVVHADQWAPAIGAEAVQDNPPWGLDRLDQRDLPVDNEYHHVVDGEGVTAYIIDTGIRITHQDFGGRARVGADFINDGRNGIDCAGHGTHVAGTVGGSTYGVAKAVDLVAVRVLNCAGSGSTSGVIKGIDWVTAHHAGPSVANMSLGGARSTATNDAVTASIDSGVTYAVAAGNSSADACAFSPASTPRALTVGSTTSSDTRSSFSNVGTCVDLFAPGSSIKSAWATSDTATNTINGTSMASPHVAGVAALYLSVQPGLTPDQLAAALLADATPGKVTGAGTGSPDLLAYTGAVVIVPSLTVRLDARPNDAQDFTFAGCQVASGSCSTFALDDDLDPTLPGSETFQQLAPGEYTISVGDVSRWHLTAVSCNGDHTVDLAARQVTVTLVADAPTTCTFTEASAAITIVHDSQPNDAQDFTLTRCGPASRSEGPLGPSTCEDVVLDDDGDPAAASQVTAAGLEPGEWTIHESTPAGWVRTGLTCDGEHVADVDAGDVAFTLDETEHLTCTFTDAQAAITIRVDASPQAAQDFRFTGCADLGCGDFSLDDDADATLPDRLTTKGVAPGTYVVEQAAVRGWGLTGVSCNTGEEVDPAAGRVTITLTAGERTTCTFTNSETSITIVEDAQPADGHDFNFTGCGPSGCGDFRLDVGGDDTLGERTSATALDPGSYRVTAHPLAGWDLTDLACTSGETVDLAAGEVEIALDEGEQTTCTFTHRSTAITIVQQTPPSNEADFTFDGCVASTSACSTFSLDDDADATLPDHVTGIGLAPGTYTLTQRDSAGWNLHSVVCDRGATVDLAGRTATVTLVPHQHTTCTFTAVDPSTLTVISHPIEDRPYQVAIDDDGNVWGTLPDADSVVKYDRATGATTVYPLPGVEAPYGIVNGPDGNLWATGWGYDKAVRIDPDTGASKRFSTGTDTDPWDLTVGPDGNLWIAGRLCDCIIVMNPANGSRTTRPAYVNDPFGPTVGPDGNVWVVGRLNDRIARLEPDGGHTSFPLTGMDSPNEITIGGDGNLWVAGYGNDSIGRVDPATGAATSWILDSPRVNGPNGVGTDAEGNVWISGELNRRIDRIDVADPTAVVQYNLTPLARPLGLVTAADGTLWTAGSGSPHALGEIVLPEPTP